MVKIKNVRPGILIIADAGLKLAPGESIELETLTPQARRAVNDGLLACTDKTSAVGSEENQNTKPEGKTAAQPASKARGKTPAQAAEGKESSKKGKGQTSEEKEPQTPDGSPASEPDDAKPEEQSKESGQQQLLGTDDAPK